MAEKALKAAAKAAAAARAARGEADPLVSLALEARVSAPCAEKVLRIIQRFDPIGCGARDLRECLLIQARWFLAEGEGKDDPTPTCCPPSSPATSRTWRRRSTSPSPRTCTSRSTRWWRR